MEYLYIQHSKCFLLEDYWDPTEAQDSNKGIACQPNSNLSFQARTENDFNFILSTMIIWS